MKLAARLRQRSIVHHNVHAPESLHGLDKRGAKGCQVAAIAPPNQDSLSAKHGPKLVALRLQSRLLSPIQRHHAGAKTQ